MEKERLYRSLIKKGEVDFSADELDTLIREYPWFDLPKILLLLQLKEKDNPDFELKLKDYGIFFHDRKRVFEILNSDLRSQLIDDLENVHRDNSEKNITGIEKDLLDFTYNAKNDEEKEDNSQSEKSEAKNKKTTDLIDRFLIEEPGVIRADKTTRLSGDISKHSTQESENLLTDTLAKIYVKQGLYSKAIFAYEKLSLKYPEKSIYFASQIEEIKEITNKK